MTPERDHPASTEAASAAEHVCQYTRPPLLSPQFSTPCLSLFQVTCIAFQNICDNRTNRYVRSTIVCHKNLWKNSLVFHLRNYDLTSDLSLFLSPENSLFGGSSKQQYRNWGRGCGARYFSHHQLQLWAVLFSFSFAGWSRNRQIRCRPKAQQWAVKLVKFACRGQSPAALKNSYSKSTAYVRSSAQLQRWMLITLVKESVRSRRS